MGNICILVQGWCELAKSDCVIYRELATKRNFSLHVWCVLRVTIVELDANEIDIHILFLKDIQILHNLK